MKKIKPAALLLWLSQLVALHSYTQNTSPYLFFKPIYAFNTASQQLDVNTTLINGQQFSKGVYGSFANGFSLAAGVGKMINNTLGIELGAEYLFGKKIVTNYSDALSDQYSDKVNALSIKPVLVLRSSGDLLAVYSKLGLAILVYSRRYEDNSYHDTLSGGSDFLITSSAVENVHPKVGFTAAFGLSFRVSESVSVFGEVNGQLLALPVYKGHYNAYSVNGTNQLASLSVHEKQWIYQKSGYLDNQDPTQPEVLLYNPPNFS